MVNTPHILSTNGISSKAGDVVRFKIEMIYPIKIFVDGELFVSNPPGAEGHYLLATRLTAIAMRNVEIEATSIEAGPCFVRVDGVSADKD